MEIEPLQSLAQRARNKAKRKNEDDDKQSASKKPASTTNKRSTKSTAAQKSTAKKSTTKKSTAKKSTSKSSTGSSSTGKRTSTTRASGLLADLKKNADEGYERADLLEGIRLAVRLAGMDVIQQTVLALVTDWVPGVGESAEKKAVDLIVKATKTEYSKCNGGEKKGLRAVIHWIRNDFDLRNSLSPSELVSGLINGQ